MIASHSFRRVASHNCKNSAASNFGRRLLSEAPSATSTAASDSILWTTHRLSPEQIVKVDAIFHKILWLDMIETSLLTEQINQRLGLTLTTAQQNAITRHLEQQHSGGKKGAESSQEGEAAPVVKLVDLKLVGYDDAAKIKVIKEVRALTGLGLKEAKELVEGFPKTIQKDLQPEAAEELKTKLEAIGAKIELS